MVTGSGQRMGLADLDRVSPRAGESGLLLGRDTDREPVLVPMFREEPTRVVLIGGPWLSSVLVFRCMAFGTRVLLRTADPQRWAAVGATTTSTQGQVALVPARPRLRARVGEPVLHVADLDGQHDGELDPDDRWQTMLTIADQLTEAAAWAISSADLVVLQRMWAPQASYLAAMLNLDPAVGAAVAALPDDAAMLLGRTTQRQLWLGPTVAEQQLFGPPQR